MAVPAAWRDWGLSPAHAFADCFLYKDLTARIEVHDRSADEQRIIDEFAQFTWQLGSEAEHRELASRLVLAWTAQQEELRMLHFAQRLRQLQAVLERKAKLAAAAAFARLQHVSPAPSPAASSVDLEPRPVPAPHPSAGSSVDLEPRAAALDLPPLPMDLDLPRFFKAPLTASSTSSACEPAVAASPLSGWSSAPSPPNASPVALALRPRAAATETLRSPKRTNRSLSRSVSVSPKRVRRHTFPHAEFPFRPQLRRRSVELARRRQAEEGKEGVKEGVVERCLRWGAERASRDDRSTERATPRRTTRRPARPPRKRVAASLSAGATLADLVGRAEHGERRGSALTLEFGKFGRA